MTRLPDLQLQLIAAAAALDREGAEPARAPGPRRRRRPAARVLVLALLTLLALAAIAVAATGLLRSGADVPTRSGKAPTPSTAFGVPTGAVAPPIEVADPSGGLPWGLRTFHTTRGYACIQVGRVQRGALGVVGRDGAFDDDGLFHALAPQVLDKAACARLDGAEQGYLALHDANFPSGGLTGSCLRPELAGAAAAAGMTVCTRPALRQLDYGLLGPHARSIVVRDARGAEHAVAVQRGSGAFLIVQPYQRPAVRRRLRFGPPLTDAFVVGRSPSAHSIVAIAYDDGHRCEVRYVPGPHRGCPAVGYVPVRLTAPGHAAVATPLHVRIDRRERAAHVWFRARVATREARAAYTLVFHPLGRGGCSTMGRSLDRDVAVGERVFSKTLMARVCHGRYRVDLSYRLQSRGGGFGGHYRYPGTAVASRTVTVR
jgi:hypothetical protein